MDIKGSYAKVNGLRQGANVFYLDGSDNTGSFRNGALQFPNPEAVQEVQVSTANTSAEFGKQPGGVFNVVTKSGTNEFHGSGFLFFRNKIFDANTWARNGSKTPRAEDKIKQGGGTVGGPIWRNRTFFFGSFMHYRDETPGFQNTRQFPTKALLGGDFSQFQRQLYDPDTSAPLAGNQIPSRLLDPVVGKLVALLPTVANLGERFVWAYADPLRNHELLAKIDHSFSSAHQIQASFFRTWGEQQLSATAAGGNVPGFWAADQHQQSEYSRLPPYLGGDSHDNCPEPLRAGATQRRPRQRCHRAQPGGLRGQMAGRRARRAKVSATAQHLGRFRDPAGLSESFPAAQL
jgi:hypothetical protein